MRIISQDSIAVAIDYQERLMPIIYKNSDILERTATLLKGLNSLEISSIVTRQYPKGLGDTVEIIKEVTTNSTTYDKISFSCYDDNDIKSAISAYRKIA